MLFLKVLSDPLIWFKSYYIGCMSERALPCEYLGYCNSSVWNGKLTFIFQECTVVQTDMPSVYVGGGQGCKVRNVPQQME